MHTHAHAFDIKLTCASCPGPPFALLLRLLIFPTGRAGCWRRRPRGPRAPPPRAPACCLTRPRGTEQTAAAARRPPRRTGPGRCKCENRGRKRCESECCGGCTRQSCRVWLDVPLEWGCVRACNHKGQYEKARSAARSINLACAVFQTHKSQPTFLRDAA